MKRKLYIAYGANTNKSVMRRRCPGARPLGRFLLTNARLVFRGVADLEFDPNSSVPCALWLIDEFDERALDRYEGLHSGLYIKSEEIVLQYKGEARNALVYLMTSRGIYPPTAQYVAKIRQGYRDFGMDESYLNAAITHAFNSKEPTDYELQRRDRQRKNNQSLAKLPESLAMTRLDAARKREIDLDPDEFYNKLISTGTATTPPPIWPGELPLEPRQPYVKKVYAKKKHHKNRAKATQPWPATRPKTESPAPKLKLTERNAVIYGD